MCFCQQGPEKLHCPGLEASIFDFSLSLPGGVPESVWPKSWRSHSLLCCCCCPAENRASVVPSLLRLASICGGVSCSSPVRDRTAPAVSILFQGFFFLCLSLSLAPLFPLCHPPDVGADIRPSGSKCRFCFFLSPSPSFFQSDSSHTRLGTEAGWERTFTVAPRAQ